MERSNISGHPVESTSESSKIGMIIILELTIEFVFTLKYEITK